MANERDRRADTRDDAADARDLAAEHRDRSAEGRDADVEALPDITQAEALTFANQSAVDRLHAGRDRDEAAGDRATSTDRIEGASHNREAAVPDATQRDEHAPG